MASGSSRTSGCQTECVARVARYQFRASDSVVGSKLRAWVQCELDFDIHGCRREACSEVSHGKPETDKTLNMELRLLEACESMGFRWSGRESFIVDGISWLAEARTIELRKTQTGAWSLKSSKVCIADATLIDVVLTAIEYENGININERR